MLEKLRTCEFLRFDGVSYATHFAHLYFVVDSLKALEGLVDRIDWARRFSVEEGHSRAYRE